MTYYETHSKLPYLIKRNLLRLLCRFEVHFREQKLDPAARASIIPVRVQSALELRQIRGKNLSVDVNSEAVRHVVPFGRLVQSGSETAVRQFAVDDIVRRASNVPR